MNLLLDTHVFIWWRSTPRAIRRATRDQIAGANAVYVSLASAWETAIKISLGKLKLDDDFESGVADSGFDPLPIAFADINGIATLPRHHGDPFDRMLIAQAQLRGLTLVTSDQFFARYNVPILWT